MSTATPGMSQGPGRLQLPLANTRVARCAFGQEARQFLMHARGGPRGSATAEPAMAEALRAMGFPIQVHSSDVDDAAAMQVILQALFRIFKYSQIVKVLGSFRVVGELILFVFGKLFNTLVGVTEALSFFKRQIKMFHWLQAALSRLVNAFSEQTQ